MSIEKNDNLINYISKNIYYKKLFNDPNNVYLQILELLKSSLIKDDINKFQSKMENLLIEDQSLNRSSVHLLPVSSKSKLYFDNLNNYFIQKIPSLEDYYNLIHHNLLDKQDKKELLFLKKLKKENLVKEYTLKIDNLTHFVLRFIANVYRDIIKDYKKGSNADDLMILRQSFIIVFKSYIINNIYLDLVKLKEYETIFSYQELRLILKRSSPNSKEMRLINFILEGLFNSEIISEFKTFDKGKSKIFYKLNTHLYELFKYPTSYNIIVPSLTIPSDWYFDTSLKEWRQNTLYSNDEKNIITLLLQSNSFRGDKLIIPNDYIINVINTQQKVPFSLSYSILCIIIDCPYFYSFKTDLNEFIKEYLKDHNLTYSKKYIIIAKRLFLRRTSILLKVNILIYLSMILTCTKQFFYNLFLDFRGRLYSNGYPIGPINDFLGRWALLIKNKPTEYDQTISSKDLAFLYLKDAKSSDSLDLFNELDCHESFYYEKNVVSDLKNKMIQTKIDFGLDHDFIFPVSIDMKCAGLGHLGLLTGNFKLLYHTHILAKSSNPIEDNDLYLFFQNCVKEYFVDSKKIIFILNNMNRPLYKKVIMKLNYNESSYSRGKFIFEELSPIILSNSESKIIDSKEFYALCYEIAKGYAKVYKELFPLEYELLNIFSEVACLKGRYGDPKFFIWQTLPETSPFNQFYFVDENFRKIYVYDPTTKSNTARSKMMDSFTDFTKNIFDFLIDTRKTKNATKPNIAHNIECSLLFKLLTMLQSLGIYVYTVHDCLYVNPKQIEIIKRCYFNVCMEFFNSSFAIENFIKLNLDVLINLQFNKIQYEDKYMNTNKSVDYSKCLILKNRLNELLELIAKNKLDINTKIQQGEYVMHVNILN